MDLAADRPSRIGFDWCRFDIEIERLRMPACPTPWDSCEFHPAAAPAIAGAAPKG
jgi:hypothetical protein